MANLFIIALTAVSAFYPFHGGVIADTEPVPPEPLRVEAPLEVRTVWVTAYSSSPDETDDTPFITASGTTVRDGIVATNLLPMGTQIMIPEHFGDKVFVVEDRMHARKKNVVDIWMPSKAEALRFGASYTEIVILKEEPESHPLALN